MEILEYRLEHSKVIEYQKDNTGMHVGIGTGTGIGIGTKL